MSTISNQGNNSAGNSLPMQPMPPIDKHTYGTVDGQRPAARDGHSGVVFDNKLIVFGGDRHHMPFNDFHYLLIDQEFSEKNII